MKKRPQPRVTATELAVLEALWDRGGLSIRQIAERLYRSGGASECATVQKLLERLESKGCVERDRKSFAHTFRAVVARGELIARELEEVADKLCEGSFTPLLVHLVEAKKLSARDRAVLQRLLEEEGRKG